MANNKVELSTGEVLIDLTSDTVTASNLLAGETAHNRSGESVTGTVNLNDYVLKSGDTMTGTLNLSNANISITGGNLKVNDTSNNINRVEKANFINAWYSSTGNKTYWGKMSEAGISFGQTTGDIRSSEITAFTSPKSQLTSTSLKVNTHDLLRMSPYFAQMFATQITANKNLNTEEFLKCGQYYVGDNAIATSLSNCPTTRAFKMTVETVNGNVYDDEETNRWALRERKILDITGNEYVSYAAVNGTAGVWTYRDWRRVATTDDLQSITDLSSAGNITSSTSWFDTGKSITITSDGWWAIEAYCVYSNGAPLNVAIVKESGNYVLEQAYAERHGVFDKTVSQVCVSHVGEYSANNVLRLWAKYNNATTNYVCIRAKKLH